MPPCHHHLSSRLSALTHLDAAHVRHAREPFRKGTHCTRISARASNNLAAVWRAHARSQSVTTDTPPRAAQAELLAPPMSPAQS